MLKDIDFKKVEDTAMAIIPEEEGNELVWNAYLINTGNSVIRSVLVNSKGYGEIEEKTVRTSSLRQFFEFIDAGSSVKVEEIREELLVLNNEFWVSFSKDGYLFDKKYVFVIDSLRDEHFIQVPVLQKRGVLIK
ncbi:MAG: hypothetical protein R2730_07020 [Chitinophagales bacterium]